MIYLVYLIQLIFISINCSPPYMKNIVYDTSGIFDIADISINCPPPPPRPATIPELLLWWCFTALIRRGKISPPRRIYKKENLRKKKK